MARLFQSVLAVHVAAGAVALLVFWVPLVTKKGGRTHRRVGWVYVAAAATLAVTGFLLCIQLLSGGSPLRWRAGIFLAYVSVVAGTSAQFGVRALRTKGRAGTSRGAVDLVPPLLLVAGGVALAALGIHALTSVLVGLLYGAMLPMFPRKPILTAGFVAPFLWTGIIYTALGVISPILNARIDWLWFVLSQIAFGLVCGFVVNLQVKVRTPQFQALPFSVRAGVHSDQSLSGQSSAKDKDQ